MTTGVTTYLSLGSNQGNRVLTLQLAIFRIKKRLGKVTAISPVYESPAWGFDAPEFLNLCIALETQLSPTQLLDEILKIERDYGRVRKTEAGYSSRPLDIDILYYGTQKVETSALTIPHPLLQERKFVLKPLADIAPQFYHPVLQKDSRNLLQECRDTSVLKKTAIRLFPDLEHLLTHLGFIAIEGNIGAGKTSLAHKISEDYNAKLILERFADNPFLPKFYKDQSRYAFPLEMSFLADRYQQFTEDTAQLDLFRNFMVSDYDIYKSLIFASITLQQEEFELYRKLFGFMYREVRKPRLYIYLYQTTERLLEQIKKRGREYELEIQPSYLEKINRGYFEFIKTTPQLNTLIIDVSELDFVNQLEHYERILDQLISYAVKEQVKENNIKNLDK